MSLNSLRQLSSCQAAGICDCEKARTAVSILLSGFLLELMSGFVADRGAAASQSASHCFGNQQPAALNMASGAGRYPSGRKWLTAQAFRRALQSSNQA